MLTCSCACFLLSFVSSLTLVLFCFFLLFISLQMVFVCLCLMFQMRKIQIKFVSDMHLYQDYQALNINEYFLNNIVSKFLNVTPAVSLLFFFLLLFLLMRNMRTHIHTSILSFPSRFSHLFMRGTHSIRTFYISYI